MGRKLDALLGRNSKTSMLKTTLKLAISRLPLLINQRRARFNIAQSDIIQLLRLNHHQQALIRVEKVIKDQNMLDVYDMADSYCRLLVQKINLIEQADGCPEELKEATSSLLYAAPRCGEFPELQEIRGILTKHFSKEFVTGAIELRSNCRVSQKVVTQVAEFGVHNRDRVCFKPNIVCCTGINKQRVHQVAAMRSVDEVIKKKQGKKSK